MRRLAVSVPRSARVQMAAVCLLVLGANPARAELTIAGLEGDALENARLFAGLADEPCDAPGWRVRRRFRQLDADIGKALHAYGYYEPTIEKTLELGGECWSARVVVDPGPVTRLRRVQIELEGEAARDAAFAASVRRDGLTEGAPLRHERYTAFKDRLRLLAAERGYVEARFSESRIDVFPEDQAADVTLVFDSGPRYRLGDVTVEQDFLDPSLVDAYLDLQPGVPYDAALISDAYQALLASGYFKGVQIEPRMEPSEDRRIPVSVRLTPGTRIKYTAGIGVSTDAGPRLRGGYDNARVNDRGHRLGAELLLSGVDSYLTANYRLPIGDPTAEWLSYNAGIRNQDTNTSETDTISLGVSRVRKMGGDWLRTEGLRLSWSDFTVGLDTEQSVLVLPSVALSRKRADRDINPRRGHSIGTKLVGTHRTLGSTTTFLQATGYARLIQPLGRKGSVIAGAEVGFTFKSDLDELPPEFRFFAGGDESVRGYAFQTLGPEDELGNVIGGTRLATVRLEYAHDLVGNFAGAVFVDAGNAFDALDWSPRIGAGIGLRWRSPVGPVRVYLAHPFTDSTRNVRFHISLGPDL